MVVLLDLRCGEPAIGVQLRKACPELVERGRPRVAQDAVPEELKSEKMLFFASPTHHKIVILRVCDFIGFT